MFKSAPSAASTDDMTVVFPVVMLRNQPLLRSADAVAQGWKTDRQSRAAPAQNKTDVMPKQ